MYRDMFAFSETGTQTERIGRTVAGKYRLEECIGLGAYSAVYRAFALHLNRRVALKMLLADPGESSQLGARFRQEATALAELRYSGVADLIEQGVAEDGAPFISMELLRGRTLHEHLESVGRLAPREAVIVTIRTARILDQLHERGFVHRDVKPANVFLENADPGQISVRLLDLGMARRLQQPMPVRPVAPVPGPHYAVRTTPGVVMGTPHYMSPEQCTAGTDLDRRSDIYSLGVMLYELLVGQPPFTGQSAARVANAHLFLRPPDLRQRGVRVSRELEAVVMRSLEKDPSRRFASMGELACALVNAARAGVDPE